MNISVSVELNLKVDEVIEAVRKAARLAMRDTIVDIAHDAIEGSPRKTGNNMRSIKYEVGPGGEVAQEDLSGAVYSTSGYGGFLETGHHTKSGSWVAARPYFKPALDRNFSAERFTEKVEKYLK